MTKMTQSGDNQSMDLPDNFFGDDSQHDEDVMQKEFPSPFQQQIPQKAHWQDPPEGGADDTKGADDTDDGKKEDFKFEDALAEAERKELEELNAKFETNFTNLDEFKSFKASLKGSDVSSQTKDIDVEKGYIGYFEEVLNPQKYSDKDLVLEDRKIKAMRAGKDIKNPEVMDAIEIEVEMLEQNGVLSFASDAVRQVYTAELKERKEKVRKFEEGTKLTKEQEDKERKENLQTSIQQIFQKGKFLSVAVKKEDLIDIYKDISQNKHIEHMKANPQDAIEFALYRKYRDIISKNLEKPSFNDGVKKTLNEFGMSNSSQTINSGSDTSNDSNDDELSYLQKFAK